jgi:NADPH:quinone reductase-like Zn-dependent oxidoreductase
LFEWYQERRLRPAIETMPMREAAKAIDMLKDRRVAGKLVLTV